MKLSTHDRDQAIRLASRSIADASMTLSRNGAALSKDDRQALLAAAVAREEVSLDVEMVAYEQGMTDAEGRRIPNRNFVRFRDGWIQRLGRSGVGRPFLRDHMQDDVTARGGTITASRTERVDDNGHARIMQTVRLTEPSAVERALRGLMSTVSIGWAGGTVSCTACKAEVFTKCSHWPGDTADGDVLVEWEFDGCELVETSEVSVPGVPTASIQGFRAALSAPDHNRARAPKENEIVKQNVCRILSLAATASDEEATRAVEVLASEAAALRASRDQMAKDNAELAVRLAAHEAKAAALAADEFIAGGVREGKLAPGSKLAVNLRAMFELDAVRAAEMLASLPKSTPVGEQRLSNQPDPTPAPGAGVDPAIEQELAAYGASTSGVAKVLRALGNKNPRQTIEKYAPRVLGLATTEEI